MIEFVEIDTDGGCTDLTVKNEWISWWDVDSLQTKVAEKAAAYAAPVYAVIDGAIVTVTAKKTCTVPVIFNAEADNKGKPNICAWWRSGYTTELCEEWSIRPAPGSVYTFSE